MVFTTDGFSEVAIESWPEWHLSRIYRISIYDSPFHFATAQSL